MRERHGCPMRLFASAMILFVVSACGSSDRRPALSPSAPQPTASASAAIHDPPAPLSIQEREQQASVAPARVEPIALVDMPPDATTYDIEQSIDDASGSFVGKVVITTTN